MAHAVLHVEQSQSRRYALSDSETVSLGRDTDNDIVIKDSPVVSRKHAELRLQDGTLWLNSHGTNGCLVNGAFVRNGRWHAASDGDEVQLGPDGPKVRVELHTEREEPYSARRSSRGRPVVTVGLVALAVVLLGVWIARQQALQERLETTEERLAEQGQMTDELRERLSGLERANERLSEKFDTQVDRIVRDSQPTSESRTQRQDFPSHVLDSVYLVSAVNNRNSVQNIGTCFSVHSSGLLVTNYHVVRNAHSVYVTYRDQYFPAKVISYDASLDVAVMQVQFPTEPLPVRRLSQETLGVDAFAIGFPWARRTGGEATVTKGIVSSVTEDRDMLITDATINPGNSGGPLVDSEGRVMGMNTSVMRTERVEGAAFAVTISSILQML